MLSTTRLLTRVRGPQQCIRCFSTRLTTESKPIQRKATLFNTNLISKRFTSSDSDALEQGITDLDMNTFHTVSEDYLETLTDSLEALSEENPQIDAEYSVSFRYETLKQEKLDN